MERERRTNKEKEVKRRLKKKVNDNIQKGGSAFYFKKQEVQKRLMEDKYDSLVQKGKLDSFLQNKKRKQDQKLMRAYHQINNRSVNNRNNK